MKKVTHSGGSRSFSVKDNDRLRLRRAKAELLRAFNAVPMMDILIHTSKKYLKHFYELMIFIIMV